MQSESDPKNPQPQESSVEVRREDSTNNKVHPQISPPQVILTENPPTDLKNNEENPLIETPLSPPNEKNNEEVNILNHEGKDSNLANKSEVNKDSRLKKKRAQELSTYQQHLLPEGVTSTEDLLSLYEMDRKKKKFGPLREYNDIHKEEIKCVVLTPDDKFMITGSRDKSIKMIDIENKQEVHHFVDAHDGFINSVCITPDGQFLLSGSDDKSIKLWNLRTKQLIHHFKDAHTGKITTLKISKDAKLVYSGSEDGSVKAFNLQTRQQVHHFQGIHEEQINAIALTPDNRFLITGSHDVSIVIFDIQAKKEIHRFEHVHDGPVHCVTTSADGRFIISGGGRTSSCVKIFDIESRQEVDKFLLHPLGKVTSVVVSSDGKYLVSGGQDCYVQITDLENRRPIHYYRTVEAEETSIFDVLPIKKCINAVAITSDGKSIVTVSEDKCARLFSMEIAKRVFTFSGVHSNLINCVTITPNQKFIISASDDKSIKVFKFKTKKEIHHFKNAHRGGVITLAVTKDSKFVISGGKDMDIKIWSLKEFKEVHHFQDPHKDDVKSIAITNDGRFFISGSSDKTFKIFDLETREEVYHGKDPHARGINSVAVTPNGNQLIAGYENKQIKIFDMKSYQLIHTFEDIHQREINSIAVTSDGKSLVSGSADGNIKVFDLETKQEIHCFAFPKISEVLSLAIFGKNYVAAGYKNGFVKIFDLEMKALVHEIPRAHTTFVQTVAVTSDGRYLVSGADDKTIKIFSLRPEEKEDRCFEYAEGEKVSAITMTPDGKYIIAGGEDKKIKFYEMSSHREVYCIDDAHAYSVTSLAVSQDYRFLVSASIDKSIKIFDVKTRKELACFEKIYKYGICIAITPDSKHIVSGSGDDFIKIIDINTHQIVYTFKEDSAKAVSHLAVTSDSKFIVAGYKDAIRIFDFERKQLLFHFKEPLQKKLESLAVSPGDKYIIAGFFDVMLVFDLQTRQLVSPFHGHRGFIEAVAMTPDSRYVVSGCHDMNIRVFDIETKKMVQCFRHSDQRGGVKRLVISPDGKFIISISYDATIKITELEPAISNPNETNLEYLQRDTFPYNSVSGDCKSQTYFNATDDFLFDPKMHLIGLKALAPLYQDLVISPFTWNILHIMALQGKTAFIKELPEMSSKLKMPFLLDHFGKTPLHYLMASRKIDYQAVNSMFSYICDHLDDCYLHHKDEFQEIMKSLSILLPFIFSKIETKLKERFLTLSFATSFVSFKEELPLFGQASSRSCFYETPVVDEKSKSMIWRDGEAQVSCQTNFLYLDYNANSQDMTTMVDLMIKQKNEDFFKTPLISKLIDHLWSQTQTPLIISFLVFSIFMSGLSVYLCLQERNLTFEVVLLALSGVFIMSEGLQMYDLGKDYIGNFWNLLDLSHLMLTVAFLITRIAKNEDELARAWISTIIVLLGYLRWVSYLRIFQATRNLIQVIITIAKDMLSFVVIIAMIIFGFSIIFLVFERESEYGIYLYNTYSILYGPLDIEDDTKYSVSLKLIMVVIAFLLNVLLLNLLISIMGDSYDKILEKRDKTDALTRLEMMSEAMTYMKFLKVNYKSKRGYLLYCLSMDVEEDENAADEWEGRINVMKKLLKQSSEETKGLKELTEKRMDEMKKDSNKRIDEMKMDFNKRLDENQEMLKNILNVVQGLVVQNNQNNNQNGRVVAGENDSQNKITAIQQFLQK